MSRRIGAMPQFVQAMIFFLGHIIRRLRDHRGDILGRLDCIGGDVNDAFEHILAVEQFEHAHWYARVDAFERDLTDAAARQGGKDLFVLPPFGPKRSFPFDIRGNPVAVTNNKSRSLRLKWSRLSEQIFRLDKWSPCRRYTSSYLMLRHSRPTNTLSRQDAEDQSQKNRRLEQAAVDAMREIVEVSGIVAFVLELDAVALAQRLVDLLDVAKRFGQD